MSAKPFNRKDFRDIILVMVIVFGTLIPVNFVHESGHALACMAHGLSPVIKIDGINEYSSVVCDGIQSGNLLTYRLAGGLPTAVIFLLIPFFIKHRVVTISCLPIGLAQIVNGILEGFAFPMYITNAMYLPSIAIHGTLLLGMIHFMKQEKLLMFSRIDRTSDPTP